MLRNAHLAAAFAAATLVAAPASATLLYSNDFDGNVSVASGVTAVTSGLWSTESVQGFSADGFSGNLLRNASTGNPATATTLTLSGLGAHDSVSIGGLLGIMDSWDSSNGSVSPDYLRFYVDGNLVLQATFANASGSVTTTVGTALGGLSHRGFNGQYADRAYDITGDAALTGIAHTASSLVLSIVAGGSGWQGSTDESWGIDNLRVDYTPRQAGNVPEPTTLALLGLAALGLGARRRPV